MAYCEKCGAYIPDGQTKCLACGYDEAAERASQVSAASAAKKAEKRETTFREEELKKELAAQRKKQQEQSRVWAEAERARRQARRERYSERAETDESDSQYNSTSTNRSAGQSSYGKVSGEMKNSRFFSILSYFSILFLIPYATRRDDRYTMYHARQGLGLFIFGILCDIVGSATGIGWALTLLRVYLMIKGVLNASNGVRAPLPIIGKYAERLK